MEVHAGGLIEMPITGVTLYDNGYAVFQREAVIQGNGSIDLYFPSDQMKAVLESLIFLDKAEKNVGNIAYETTKPTANIKISEDYPLVGLLKSLVGSLLSVQVVGAQGLETVEGRILGIDQLLDVDTKVPSDHVSLLLEGGKMRALSLRSVHSFHALDSQVQKDLGFSLDLFRSHGLDGMQKLSVFFSDVGSPQKLVARYGFKVNEWKSSYRVTFSDHPTIFHLEGLAVVENTLDEDWNNINLVVVVGAPPLDSESTSDQGSMELLVKTLDGSQIRVRVNPKDSILSLKGKVGKKKGLGIFSFKLMFSGKPLEEGRLISDYTIANQSVVQMEAQSSSGTVLADNSSSKFVMAAVHNLSFYPISIRVTAKRKQKAIVPLLRTEVEGQKVVLFDETIRQGNPLCAFLFENKTGRTLEGGSLQISSDVVFLGHAVIPTIHVGDESPPIPYAVELGCEVVKSKESTYFDPHEVTIADGVLKLYRIQRYTTSYKIKNRTESELDFILNHLFYENGSLVQDHKNEEEEPVDITDRFYQFRFKVQPKDEKKVFRVIEHSDSYVDYPLRTLPSDTASTWYTKKYLDAPTEQSLRETFSLRNDITSIEKQIYEKESEVREATSAQEQLRSNIAALEHNQKDAAKYIKSLGTEQDKLDGLRLEIKASQSRKKDLERKLSTMIDAMKMSKKIPK